MKFDGMDLVYLAAVIAYATYKIICERCRHEEIMKHGYIPEDKNDGTEE